MSTRKTYTAEFKHQAVELSRQDGMSAAQVAQDLGISTSALYQWRKEAERKGEYAFPGRGNQLLTPEQQEIQRLRRENEILRQEREILKKAAACLEQRCTHMGLLASSRKKVIKV